MPVEKTVEDKDPFNNAPDFVKVLTNDEVSKLYNKGSIRKLIN